MTKDGQAKELAFTCPSQVTAAVDETSSTAP
jgi:hypothetical protein